MVIVILAALATVFVPRFVGGNLRLAEKEALDAQRLLTVAAEKSLLSGQPVAVMWDGAARRLQILVQRPPTGPGAPGTSAPGTPLADAAPIWRADGLVEPADLSHLTLKRAVIDGRPAPASGWRVVFQPAEARSDLRLILEPEGAPAGSEIEVGLAPESAIATRTGFGVTSPSHETRVVDLDDAGRGNKPW